MKSFTFLTGLLISFQISAQDSTSTNKITSYKDSLRFYEHAYIGFGYANNEQLSNLNNLTRQYFPKAIPEQVIGLLYGGKSVFGSVLLQGEVGLAAGTNGRRNVGRTSLFQGYISVDAGLMLTPPGAVRIYPFAGLGADVVSVSLKQSANNIRFDSLIANPVIRESMDPISFSTGFFTWRAGLSIDIAKGKTSNPFMSVRAGYRQSFNTPRWNFEGDNGFIGTPSDRLKQWFGGVVFYSQKHKMKDRSGRK